MLANCNLAKTIAMEKSHSIVKNQLFQFKLNVDSLAIDLRNIVRATGYKSEKLFPNFSLLNSLYNEIKNMLTPECAYIVSSSVYCSSNKGEIKINNVVLNTGKIISSSLKDISQVAIFIGTVGKNYDVWLEGKNKIGDPYIEYLTDLIGSEIAESIARWIHKKIEEHFSKEQLNCSNRFSPGYCGWNVKEQKKIFDFFPQHTCGITLTESSLMLPIKSVSGIIGIGKNVEWEDYPCEVCNVPFCYKNRRSTLV